MIRSLALASLLAATAAVAAVVPPAAASSAPVLAPASPVSIEHAHAAKADPFACPFCGGSLDDFRAFVRVTLLTGVRAVVASSHA